MRLYLDLETFSQVPISAGTHVYARSAEIILLAYAWEDEPAQTVPHPTPAQLRTLVDAAGQIVIHNSAFDRAVLRHNGVEVPISRTIDTMALALGHGLPGSLDALCGLLKVPVDQAKDKEGRKLIHLFCKPQPVSRKLRRATADTHPEEWARFAAYASRDVEACREVLRRLPRKNAIEVERRVWELDQRINDRGVQIDTDLVRGARATVSAERLHLTDRTIDQTGGAVASAAQRDAVLKYLETVHNVVLPDLRSGTVERMLDANLSGEVRELLLTRLQATTTSVAKYDALARSTCPDGRLRGTLQYCGASRTGRWAGRLFQPQNLPRPALKQPEIDAVIAALKTETAHLVLDNVMEAASAALRGCIIAPPGRQLVVADLSNIEGRVLAWLAGEQWKVDAFSAFDAGAGPDLYKLAYARAYAKAPEDVTKDERQIGKVMELACGYQGGVGAFSTMGALYGLTFEEARAKELVQAWRKAHPLTTALWRDCEEAALLATRTPGEAYIVGGCLWFCREGAWLRVMLPSGRHLCYPAPQATNGKLTYMGTDQYSRKWSRLKTYGGKLVENITQAVARDVLAHGMLLAEAAGYEVVLSVHDELITETGPRKDVAGLVACMTQRPHWAETLPLAAAGFAADRYRKD